VANKFFAVTNNGQLSLLKNEKFETLLELESRHGSFLGPTEWTLQGAAKNH
jgi:hypothetical protein